ncbi:MAG: chromosome segregation ATPase [Patiriisocius sp.]|jgi:chromosome segregation ATPase
MNNLLPSILFFLLIGSVGQAQDLTPEQIVLGDQIESLKEDLAKFQKKKGQKENIIKASEKQIKEAELSRDQVQAEKLTKEDEINVVKSEMEGFNLSALEDKVKMIEGDKRKLSSTTDRNTKGIAKKRGQIETLYAEIGAMEDEINKNDEALILKEEELQATNNEISSNGLVEKEAALKIKTAERSRLVKSESRFETKITKEKSTIEKAIIELDSINRNIDSKKDLIKQKQVLLNQ